MDTLSRFGLSVTYSPHPTHFSTHFTPTLIDFSIVSEASNVVLFDQISVSGISKHDLIYCSYRTTIPIKKE